VEPIALGPNMPDTFYRGAGHISSFRGTSFDPHPEDWIASTTSRFGAAPAGLTRLPGGALLVDVIEADPLAWLGPDHVARFGVNPALLIKLLDAGQRLPVHAHPDRTFATEHLASPYGKTEAWIVLDAPADAAVWLGFTHDISADELTTWVARQDVTSLLAATNRVPIRAGDALLCPAGMPHAIGEGILLLELQEPTDFSVLLEWDGFPLTQADAALGLPLEVALQCLDRRRCGPARLAELRGHPNTVGTLLPAEADQFFIAERVGAGSFEAGFSTLIVTSGSGQLNTDRGNSMPQSMQLRRGQTVLIPFAAGDCTISGDLSAIRCRPGQQPAT
jgi:mannose-6-phosphate isomerase